MKPAACCMFECTEAETRNAIENPKETIISLCKKGRKLRCHGGLHTVGACHKCQQGVKDKLIPKSMADPRWKEPACKIYMFPGKESNYTQLLQLLGTEDNQNYKLDVGFHDIYRSVRTAFLEKYALRDQKGDLDPRQVWPSSFPHTIGDKTYKSLYAMKHDLMEQIKPLVFGKSDVQKSASQLVALATRTFPVRPIMYYLCRSIK
jgi:hypothetical protein